MAERSVKSAEVVVNLKRNRVELRIIVSDEETISLFSGTDAAQDLASQLFEAVRALRRG